MSGRAVAVLERFPRHLGATDPGKRFGAVVTGLAADLDVLTGQMQTVRRSRRIDEAPTVRDLLAIAGLHGLGEAALVPLARRCAAAQAAIATIPADPETLSRLFGVPAGALAALGKDLAAAVAAALHHRVRLDLQCSAILAAIGAHRAGNTTPTALLLASAAYLGLEPGQVHHVAGGWWHLTEVSERLRLVPPPAPADGTPAAQPPDLTPVPGVLALEENPVRRADIEPEPKTHGERTRILRGGLEDIDVTIRVVGVEDRTVRPMIVHLGAGHGVVYEGDVPGGRELAFGSTGRVTLDGTDVTGSCWSFTGAVYADECELLPGEDCVFTEPDGTVPAGTASAGAIQQGSPARFVTAQPVAGAFDPSPPFPHGGAAVGPLQLPRGESRWTALVCEARAGGAVGEAAIPRTAAGRFGASVFAAASAEKLQPAMKLGFGWEEHEPFTVRVLLPRRLSALDDDAGALLRQPLARLLNRHRAAGVELRVEYADPRWSLGQGVVRAGADGTLGVVIAGTELWPDGTPQPEPQEAR